MFFLVDGNPTPQGSKTAYVRGGRAVLVEANKKLPAWRSAVTDAARQAMTKAKQTEPLDGPLRVAVTFFMPRPAKPKWAIFPASKPDLDKLIRGVLDSLTKAGLIKDDALVVEILASKLWVSDRNPNPGCSVLIEPKLVLTDQI